VYYVIQDMNKLKDTKVQGLVGEASFSIILPRDYAVNLGIEKGDFIKVRQEEGRLIVEKYKATKLWGYQAE
jgi:formylmethanofuran dehydrogenase subunit D